MKQKIDQIYKDWLYDSQRLLTIKYENSKIKDDYKTIPIPRTLASRTVEVWINGYQPAVTTGAANKADFFTFVAVNTHNNGPKGSGAPNNTVIYGTVVQNMY